MTRHFLPDKLKQGWCSASAAGLEIFSEGFHPVLAEIRMSGLQMSALQSLRSDCLAGIALQDGKGLKTLDHSALQ